LVLLIAAPVAAQGSLLSWIAPRGDILAGASHKIETQLLHGAREDALRVPNPANFRWLKGSLWSRHSIDAEIGDSASGALFRIARRVGRTC
jgi:hypothetical protein